MQLTNQHPSGVTRLTRDFDVSLEAPAALKNDPEKLKAFMEDMRWGLAQYFGVPLEQVCKPSAHLLVGSS